VTGSPFSIYKDTHEFFQKWDSRYDYLSRPTKEILKILDEFNIRATFFVVADIATHYPGLVESISDNGHEIACHGLHHACKIDPTTKKQIFSAEVFEERTRLAKIQLEKISGQMVVGYRAPNALFGQWMWNSLHKLGFTYDSSISINSLYNKADHVPVGVTSTPYFPIKNSNNLNNFIEFPFSYLDLLGLKIPTSGGPMLRFLGDYVILKGLRQSLCRGHTTFYFHPIDISTEKFPSVGKGRPLYWVVKGDRVKKRIKNIFNNIKDVEKICLKDALKGMYHED